MAMPSSARTVESRDALKSGRKDRARENPFLVVGVILPARLPRHSLLLLFFFYILKSNVLPLIEIDFNLPIEECKMDMEKKLK